MAIGPYDILHDANGNLTRQTRVGTTDIVHYVYDEENRLACVHKGQQVPNPSCDEQGINPLEFVYDHAGVRKRKDAGQPTFYPNQFLTDIGGGAGGQFKHIFLGAMRILTMKVIPPPDKQQWFYHPDHLGLTSIVTNEKAQLSEHTHYFPYGEVWLQERPSTPVPYLFSSKELDPETGLYDFGERYLNPRFAQWMTTDPALGDYLGGEGIHTPPNLALYGYSWNNPATLHDPDGDIVFIPLIIAGAVWADRAYTAYTVYRDVQKVRSGEMSGVEFAEAHATDVVPGRGAVKAGQAFLGVFKRTGGEVAEAAAKKVGPQVPSAVTKHADDTPAPRGRPCSFAEATPVATEQGLKPIGNLKLGDRVLARSEASGTTGYKPIIQVFRHHDPVKLHLTLEDPATHTVETIQTTPEHPFHVPGRGFVEAAALKPGDPVSRAPSAEPAQPLSTVSLTADLSDTSGALRVKALTLEDQPFWAYNLEVADHHTFFVGQTQAWVHNGPCDEAPSPVRAGEAGRFADLEARGVGRDQLTPHHMPQKARGFTTPEEGGALMLPHGEHTLTRTYFGRGRIVAEREADLPFRRTLARDIRDVRSI